MLDFMWLFLNFILREFKPFGNILNYVWHWVLLIGGFFNTKLY